MKAIETRYKGYRFRSRLEARWAVFFDALGVKWEYEPEGFDLGSKGRYLPDFWIPVLPSKRTARMGGNPGYWVEIKGAEPTEAEKSIFQALCVATQNHGYLFCGAPGENEQLNFSLHGPKVESDDPATKAAWATLKHLIEKANIMPIDMLIQSAIVWMCSDATPDQVLAAIAAARGARFEFGENGAA